MDEPHRASFWVPDKDWAVLVSDAKAKDALSDRAAWTRRWTTDFNLAGEVGQWLYELLSGTPRKRGFGDGGEDFPGLDVKATKHYDNPYLRLVPTEPLRVPVYVCVAVDLRQHMARYVGYATREEMQEAPIRTLGRHGLRLCLTEAELHHELPPT